MSNSEQIFPKPLVGNRRVSSIVTHRTGISTRSNLLKHLSRIHLTNPPRLLDPLFLIGVELLILATAGLLTRSAPYGDDAIVHINNITNLARNFPNLLWDPRSFNGYSPAIGFPWGAYGFLALPVSLGVDPIGVFQAAFVAFSILLGLSLYYLSVKVGAPRIVAVSASIIAWSAIGFWEYSIRGGAYTRIFTLPFMFTALAVTYAYANSLNRGKASNRYWLVLLAWFPTILGDVYISLVGIGIATLFLLLSAGWRNLRTGLLRWAKLFLPVLALTSWYTLPLAEFFLTFGSVRSDPTPSLPSQVYWIGPALTIGVAWMVRRRSTGRPIGEELKAIIVSVNIISVYFLIMGWPNPLWLYLPRIMAAYDSLSVPSLIFPILVASLFGLARRIGPIRLTRQLAMLLLLIATVNAVITIPFMKPLDWTGPTAAFNQSIAQNISPSNNYRVSLQGRPLTRWFPYYYPDTSETGGRLFILDQNVFYQSWYQTDVFFKGDLATLNNVYIEDQPYRNTRHLLSTPNNFAEITYWLDWFGVSSLIILNPSLYYTYNTVAGYTERAAIFSTSESMTSYGPIFYENYNNPTPILVATNTSVVGFYSQQQNSGDEYNALLALLSYLGLGPRYVVPIDLESLDQINPGLLDLLITDSNTFSMQSEKFSSLETQGLTVLVVPSQPNPSSSAIASQPSTASLNPLQASLPQLQSLGTSGSNDLLAMISPILKVLETNSSLPADHPSQTVALTPAGWRIGFTRNAYGSLHYAGNNLSLDLGVNDPTLPAQLNLDYSLPNPIPLSQGVTNLSAESSSNVVLGEVFRSSNFTSNYVSHSDELAGGEWTSLQIPFANYTTVYDPTQRFFMADGFSIAVNVPAGHATATLQLGNMSLAHPAFQIYTLPVPVSLATNGFFEDIPSLAQNSTIVLTDPTGDFAGSYDTRGSPYSAVTPLAEFSSEANQVFTEIIIEGQASSTHISLVTPQQSRWVSVESKWQTNQEMTIPTLPAGFRGIVWKETYTSAWSVQGTSKNGQASPQAYYLAGPGLVYIPLDGPLTELKITYHPFSPPEILIFVILAASVIPVIVFRKKIYGIGAGIRNHVQTRDKPPTASPVPDDTIATMQIRRVDARVINTRPARALASAQ